MPWNKKKEIMTCSFDEEFAIPDRLTEEIQRKAKKISEAYDTREAKWTWTPNAADSDPMEPPSGFALKVSGNPSRIDVGAFSPQSLFNGTMILSLKGTKFEDGSVICREKISEKMSSFRSKLNLMVKQNSGSPPKLSNYDEKNFREVGSWQEEMGDGGYVGLFESTEKGDYKYENDYWLVARAVCREASEDLYSIMEEGGAEFDWETFFLKEPKTRYIYELNKRNRMRLLASAAKAFEIASPFKPDLVAVDPGKHQVLSPTVHTVSNMVGKKGKDHIYYNESFDPSNWPDEGVAFNETPHYGPSILFGPGKGVSTGFTSDAFPLSTGRRIRNGGTSPKSPTDSDILPFTWEGGQINERLNPFAYHSRDSLFKEKEKKIGYDHLWKEIRLKPVMVKIPNTS